MYKPSLMPQAHLKARALELAEPKTIDGATISAALAAAYSAVVGEGMLT